MSEDISNKEHALKILKDDIENKTGFSFVKIEDGIAVSELDLQEYHFNPYGIPYGGVLFTMADDTAQRTCGLPERLKGCAKADMHG